MSNAVPFHSPLGYTLRVPPTFAMTQEEPCCDQAWLRGSDGNFMRIERIDPELPLDGLRDDVRLALSAVGEAVEDPAPDGPPGHDVELLVHATSAELSSSIMVSRVGEGRYRVTRHVPAGPDGDAVADGMEAMLASMRTTGPWRRP